MNALLALLRGSASSLLGGVWGYVAAGAAAAVVAGWLTHAVDDRKYKALELADARTQITTITNAVHLTDQLATMSNQIGVQLASGLDHTYYVTQTITKEVPKYVTPETDARYPLPCGMFRVRDAAILQEPDPSSLVSDACASDDARAPVSASALSQEDAGLIGRFYVLEQKNAALVQWGNGVLKIWDEYRAKSGAAP